MPSLRERIQDVRALALHFVDAICRSENLPAKRLSDMAVAALLAYSWPGNVRQLQHAVEMAVVLSGDRMMLVEEDFARRTEPELGGLRICGACVRTGGRPGFRCNR